MLPRERLFCNQAVVRVFSPANGLKQVQQEGCRSAFCPRDSRNRGDVTSVGFASQSFFGGWSRTDEKLSSVLRRLHVGHPITHHPTSSSLLSFISRHVSSSSILTPHRSFSPISPGQGRLPGSEFRSTPWLQALEGVVWLDSSAAQRPQSWNG